MCVWRRVRVDVACVRVDGVHVRYFTVLGLVAEPLPRAGGDASSGLVSYRPLGIGARRPARFGPRPTQRSSYDVVVVVFEYLPAESIDSGAPVDA